MVLFFCFALTNLALAVIIDKMGKYANIIVDISIEKLDKPFQYLIPEELQGVLQEGMKVDVPFGSRRITGYVLEITDTLEFDESKLKPIIGIASGSVTMEEQLMALAAWMRRNCGSTMNQAMKTVLPVKQTIKQVEKRTLRLLLEEEEAKRQLALMEAKHYVAKARLLRELITYGEIDYTVVTQKLQVSAQVVKSMVAAGILEVESNATYRNPVGHLQSKGYHLVLNEEQQAVVDTVMKDRANGDYKTYLLKGVTGSGKTEVYMEMIARVIAEGKQAIVLIPEIALTYQTVMRFRNRFGDRVSILNSRLSAGERYDQYLRAKNGDIDIMIGPRSALFSPFPNLGLIIIDEEHESSYKSDSAPRYHARDVAMERARVNGASVVLGSATPSLESYYAAKSGNYVLLEMKNRVMDKALPNCEVIDLREELRLGNRSILSARLQELMEDRLQKGQQIMLFMNRRGIAGTVSCRKCGHVIKCPHCDVSLSLHESAGGQGKMLCHYCGYEEPQHETCPACGSKLIGTFKAGTQKIEKMVQERFPSARILRMDWDTTRGKDDYEKILQSFGNGEADILIGTQMIVKGHDFGNVTLMGILAADMSLHVSDYHAAERTFQLLTQAAGRAGRGDCSGDVIIQSYDPEHYAITTAKAQDYEAFYETEIAYRKLMHYPPVWNLLVIMGTSAEEALLTDTMNRLKEKVDAVVAETKPDTGFDMIGVVGPAEASISKVNDMYRKVIYIKTADYKRLVQVKDAIEGYASASVSKDVNIQFDFNPMSGF